MILYNESDNKYGTEALCREFLRGGELSVSETEYFGENDAYLSIKKSGKGFTVTASDGARKIVRETEKVSSMEKDIDRAVYDAMSELTGINPPWGILTGVRPVKLALMMEKSGLSEEETEKKLSEEYRISDDRLNLLMKTAESEKDIIAMSVRNSVSMYISIPFCPTRCSYCSFTSQSIEKAKKLIPQYVDLLCTELCDTALTIKNLGLRLESIYMGGGTPTVLSADELDRVLTTVRENFDMDTVREITVEAGRPDTINPEKLGVMRKHGVGRISVNPQSMNDEVLKNIGRGHTAEDIVKCYDMVRAYGFESINMDLISGLPGDTAESFRQSIEKVLEMRPENITLHTLTLKHGSYLKPEQEKYLAGSVIEMNEYAYRRFTEEGYHPYYLYRQKGSVENLENVGYCLDGKEGIYNIFIMDETHSILSTGAGGVTKLRNPETGYIERVSNFKFPYEYIDGFSDISVRKKKISSFYTGSAEIHE